MKFTIPLILIALAAGALFVLVLPQYDTVKGLMAERARLEKALKNAQESEALFAEKVAAYNTISDEDRIKLERILPTERDAVRLIIYLNNVARASGVSLEDITVPDVAPTPEGDSSGAPVGYQPVDVAFKFTGSYGQLTAFLTELERSLRIFDIAELSFVVPEKGLPSYSLSVRTYWKN